MAKRPMLQPNRSFILPSSSRLWTPPALLADDDVATLKLLEGEGMGDNTLRALASELGYIEA